jgi:hypothetical protein
LQLLATILTQLQFLVASIKALDLLYQAMYAVPYCRTAMAINTLKKHYPQQKKTQHHGLLPPATLQRLQF